jgi:integrase
MVSIYYFIMLVSKIMSIKKQSDNSYLVDIRPNGRNGKRYRKKLVTKSEAVKYEKYILSQYHQKEWLEKPKDHRRISELIPIWFKYHGMHLKDGDKDLKRITNINNLMDNPRVCDLSNKFLAEFAANRLTKIKATTYNRDIAVMSSLFTQLSKAEIIHADNPFKGKKQKEKRVELSFLTSSEIKTLLSLLEGDSLLIAKVCLSVGARWGEAESLRVNDVHNQKITFSDTKNGKPRSVPITKELFEELRAYKKVGRLFNGGYRVFMYRLRVSCIELPKGQASHVLRHTFASHFMMNGGNLLVLQKVLGHGDIKMTMRYAHLAPDYLVEVLDKNPLSQL